MIKNDISWLANLEGKTFQSAKSFAHESMLNYFIDLTFTDDTKQVFLNCKDYQIYDDEEVSKLFNRLWTKAGTDHYNKSEWMELKFMLNKRGIRF